MKLSASHAEKMVHVESDSRSALIEFVDVGRRSRCDTDEVDGDDGEKAIHLRRLIPIPTFSQSGELQPRLDAVLLWPPSFFTLHRFQQRGATKRQPSKQVSERCRRLGLSIQRMH